MITARRIRGEHEEAVAALEALITSWTEDDDRNGLMQDDNCDLGREAITLGRPDLLERLLSLSAGELAIARHTKTTWTAIAAETNGHYDQAHACYQDAEGRWRDFGDKNQTAHALLGQGRCLTHLGRTTEATPVLRQAREIFQHLQAAPALAETDQLLQQATALSS